MPPAPFYRNSSAMTPQSAHTNHLTRYRHGRMIMILYISGSLPKCKQNTSSSELRDTEWATQNCTLSFNSAGKVVSFFIESYDTKGPS